MCYHSIFYIFNININMTTLTTQTMFLKEKYYTISRQKQNDTQSDSASRLPSQAFMCFSGIMYCRCYHSIFYIFNININMTTLTTQTKQKQHRIDKRSDAGLKELNKEWYYKIFMV